MLTAKEWSGLLFVIFQSLLTDEGLRICHHSFLDSDTTLSQNDLLRCFFGYEPYRIANMPGACSREYRFLRTIDQQMNNVQSPKNNILNNKSDDTLSLIHI